MKKIYLNQLESFRNEGTFSSRGNFLRWMVLKVHLWNQQRQNKKRLNWLLFSLSLILRVKCIFVLCYVLVIMINESDSWIPALNLIFCLGILIDLVCFVRSKKEHVG